MQPRSLWSGRCRGAAVASAACSRPRRPCPLGLMVARRHSRECQSRGLSGGAGQSSVVVAYVDQWVAWGGAGSDHLGQ